MQVLTRALTVDLGFLVVAAALLFAAAGKHRTLGRAFDLACVAALPLVFVDLTATTVVRAFELAVPSGAKLALTGASFAWAGALLVLALSPARSPAPPRPEPRDADVARARVAGWAVVAVAVVGTVVQVTWIARNMEVMRPMTKGDEAPGFALPAIGTGGALGAALSLGETRGKIVVLDFWATWCGPCLAAMPGLAALARKHAADVEVITINLDDPAEARAIFDRSGYSLHLVADDGRTSERYGVTTIPHTVVIDRAGVVRSVHRGGGKAAEHEVERMLDAEIAK
jgi:thiol-disulfide isomerase/thioredoxin